jgi:hypothetical protein
VRDRHKARNSKVAGDIEHPHFASDIGKLPFEVVDVGIVEPPEVDRRALQAIVPPDCVGIAFHQLEEALHDGFLHGVAGSAAVGIGVKPIAPGPPWKK